MDTATPPLSDERTLRIRGLNDTLRRYGAGGQIILSSGVAHKDDDFIATAFRAAADFEAFTEENDPYGEHDFGSFTVDGESLFFKIDYYDPARQHGSDDPADPRKTCRVMTILLAAEY